MNILDIFVLAVIILAAVYGWARGFIRTVFSVVFTILVIIITIILTPIVSNSIIKNTEFDEKISEQVIYLTGVGKIEETLEKGMDMRELVDKLPIPEEMSKLIKDSHSLDFSKGVSIPNYSKYIGDKVASVAVNYLVFVVLFLIITMIFNIVLLQLELIAKLPVLKQLNRTLGLGVGVFLGIIVIWVSCLLLTFWLSVQSTQEISNLIEQSIFMKLFFLNNPIQKFVMGLL